VGASVRRLDRERPPAGADLEKPGALADLRLVEDRPHLAQLGVLERLPVQRLGAVEERRAVGEAGVEERREEVVGQVVVRLDVATGAREGVALPLRNRPIHDLPHRQPGPRDGSADALGERTEHVCQVRPVRCAPVAGHVALADADLRVLGQALEERRRSQELESGPYAAGLGCARL